MMYAIRFLGQQSSRPITNPGNYWTEQLQINRPAICTTGIIFTFSMYFCPGTMTTQAESINSDLQRGLDRRLRHI